MEAEWAEDETAWLPQSLITKCIGTEKTCGEDLQLIKIDADYDGNFYAGLDFAKHQDYSAFALIEDTETKYFLRYLKIWPHEVPYAAIIGWIKVVQDRLGEFRCLRADKKGLHPIYGDTDSLFLEDPTEKEIQWLIKTAKNRLKLDLSVEERYNLCVLPKAAKAYFGIKKDGTADIKGLTAIKSNSPKFLQNVFNKCIKQLTTTKNQSQLHEAKKRINNVVRDAIKDHKAGKIPIQNLEYQVKIHEPPEEKLKAKALHQPYQCALQLLDSGKTVKRGDEMHFVKVKPFNYQGKKFTVKPTEHVNNFREINVEDYIRNLKTALNQVFKPMKIKFTDKEPTKRTLSDFISN
jgi:DNA polymerase elongation subunit (family B)